MRRIATFCYDASLPIIIVVVIINITALVSFFRFELDTDFLNFFYFRESWSRRIHSEESWTLSRPILANAFGLAIGLSVFFFSPLRIHMQVASVMWVAMVVSSMGGLLLIPLFYSGGNDQPKKKAV